jgi:hypothetical protein
VVPEFGLAVSNETTEGLGMAERTLAEQRKRYEHLVGTQFDACRLVEMVDNGATVTRAGFEGVLATMREERAAKEKEIGLDGGMGWPRNTDARRHLGDAQRDLRAALRIALEWRTEVDAKLSEATVELKRALSPAAAAAFDDYARQIGESKPGDRTKSDRPTPPDVLEELQTAGLVAVRPSPEKQSTPWLGLTAAGTVFAQRSAVAESNAD